MFGLVGIDGVARPSAVVVVVDARTDPRLIAMDLQAQAERDAAAHSIRITDSADLADAMEAAVAGNLPGLPRAASAGASWRDHPGAGLGGGAGGACTVTGHAPGAVKPAR